MQTDAPRHGMSALLWLLVINASVFVLTLVIASFGGGERALIFQDLFGLSPSGFQQGMLWSLVTYGFLHAGPFHLLSNGIGLFFLGRILQPMIGERRLVSIYVVGTIAGGLMFLLVNWGRPSIVVGASAAVSAFLALFASMRPDERYPMLLLPFMIKPKYILWVFGGITVFGFLFQEIPGRITQGDPVAHSAHLGGLLAGWLYFRFVLNASPYPGPVQRRVRGSGGIWGAARPEAPRRSSPAKSKPVFSWKDANRDELRAEVDRILDKINTQGFGSLSEEEKTILDRARDILSR